MSPTTLNSGVVFTNKNCIGCNKCISGCPVTGANVVVKEPSSDLCTVLVDPMRCIMCGSCITACVHVARTYRDDTDDFFEALARGEPISLLVAPTLLTDYEKQYHNILGYLRACGARHIYNTGFGADIMVWVYMNFILLFGLDGVISQFCPVIVNYLEKYRPELLHYLMPVQSPVMCTAIYVSDYLDNKDQLAYISPCIAGKYEISDVNTYGKIKYNVTFERLMDRIENADLSDYHGEDEIPYGLGALISTSGGLSENIKQYIGFNEVLIQTSGPTNIFSYFNHYYYREVNQNCELPFLVDAMSCTDGCNFGTGTNCGSGMRNEMAFSAHRSKERAFRSGFVYTAFNYNDRLEKLNSRFADLDLTSFVRQYGNDRQLQQRSFTTEELEDIYLSMYKYSPEQRHTDCGSCGYKTCHHMAHAIADKLNYKDNCINYAKECIRRETEKTNLLLEEISDINEELRKSTQLKSNFLANMSHEIRTPMNAIIGMAEMALRGQIPNEERSYLEQIKSSGRSLLAIINDILDFSKIESGKMELNLTEYAVMSILNDTVNIVLTHIGEKDITLTVNAEPNIPFKLRGDDIRIKQILVNLTNNAVKFTEKGCVEITLRHERRKRDLLLHISVRDTGMGIKPEDQEKLFTSFQQVDSKRNRNIEGTGLGLAISREFVRLMDGHIDLQSTYGQGSTFSFCVPQEIVVDLPSVRGVDGDTFRIATLIQNPYVAESFQIAADQLQLSFEACRSLSQLADFATESMGKGATVTTFAFVQFSFWGDDLEAFAQAYPHLQLVLIVDPRKEAVSSSLVRKLNQPVYSMNLASVLHWDFDEGYSSERTNKEARFEAPEARILVVDDNTINLTVTRGLLAPMHMEIDVATGALEAIAKLEQTQYDIIFMDHMMPDIDGIEATHMIRAKGGVYETIPIIALTANAINNAKDMFLSEGLNDFVAKPIDMLDITAKLRHWLPSEKIYNLGSEKGEAVKVDELPDIQDIDVRAGLALSGSLPVYKSILADYHAGIPQKLETISTAFHDGDWKRYTIEVHGLKSASRLIGATDLANLSTHLEDAGHRGELPPIHALTDELLRRLKAYLPILAPYAKSKGPEKPKALLPPHSLKAYLQRIFDAADDFDSDAIAEPLEALSCGLFSPAEEERLLALETATTALDYDAVAELSTAWLSTLDG